MAKRMSLKSQFIIILIATLVVWSCLSEFYWQILARFVYKVIEEGIDTSFEFDIVYIAGTVILLIFYTIPLVFFMLRNISEPVKKIITGIKNVGEGNYSLHLDVKGASEFIEIAEAFNKMSEELSQIEKIKADAEKERILLFANMAHDIRTPVTSILGCMKALSDGMVSDEAKKQEYIETSMKKAVRISELTDRLFEYVKLESPEYILHKKDCDLPELLRNSVANLYSEFEAKKISLELNIIEKSVIKNIDPLEIDRVFTNLLNNALKHNESGIKVLVEMDSDGKTLICDSGKPIPSDTAAHLFKPFVSGDKARTSKSGSGLGLALSYKIMKKHGGNLSYKSPCGSWNKGFVVEFE